MTQQQIQQELNYLNNLEKQFKVIEKALEPDFNPEEVEEKRFEEHQRNEKTNSSTNGLGI